MPDLFTPSPEIIDGDAQEDRAGVDALSGKCPVNAVVSIGQCNTQEFRPILFYRGYAKPNFEVDLT
jgi:hypothetical protein